MKVLIVAKTHMQNAACVGGILANNRSVRLLQPNGHNHPTDTDYQIGQIWEIEFQERQDTTPPHVEDILVQQRRKIGTHPALRKYLTETVSPWKGKIDNLYDNHIRFTQRGRGYISHRIGLPKVSTGYWLPDKSLICVTIEGKPYYKYESNLGNDQFIHYVGFENPIEIIHPNTLVRVSLARWWRPDDRPTMEKRCYLQLSGWYL